jgi:hypothetical protein
MGGIFDGNINARATAAMMIAMLLFACAWESFTNWLEAKVRKLVMAPSRRSGAAVRCCALRPLLCPPSVAVPSRARAWRSARTTKPAARC